MHVLITHTEPAPMSLPHRIQDLDQLILTKHREAAALEDQIEALKRKQKELDRQADEAFCLRNDIAQALGRDDVYEDMLSLIESK